MDVNFVGTVLANRIARLPPADQEQVRSDFSFTGQSQGLDQDLAILRRCREITFHHLQLQKKNK
tara:strand:- start:2274 stop:2465 length:192 start_codon:yes stop_codon:yes gene_type:complete